MHTTWRATAAHWLLGVGVVLAGIIALVTSGVGASVALMVLGWSTVAFLAAGLILSVLQHRERERFRRHLARGLTHHLRTSLANIQAYDEMLLLGNERSEDERLAWLEVIGREANRLGSAIENVLMIFNDRRMCEYPARRSVDLGALLEDVACGYDSDACTGFQFEQSPPSGIMINADPNAIRHALDNLFHSLGPCRAEGGDLRAALTSDGATAKIRLELNGAPSQSPDASGGPFRVADLEGSTDAGFGLEIAVVQHVVRAHGGRFTSVLDNGRTGFQLELPIARA